MDTMLKHSIYDVALLTSTEMGKVDRLAMTAGVSGPTMMKAAGPVVADAIKARWSNRPVTVPCGPGNNSGDGFMAARHLAAAGCPVARDLDIFQAASAAAWLHGEGRIDHGREPDRRRSARCAAPRTATARERLRSDIRA